MSEAVKVWSAVTKGEGLSTINSRSHVDKWLCEVKWPIENIKLIYGDSYFTKLVKVIFNEKLVIFNEKLPPLKSHEPFSVKRLVI